MQPIRFMSRLSLANTVLKSWPFTFYCACHHGSNTTRVKKDLSRFLLNDELLQNQTGLCYRYHSQLLCPNLGQLRSIVLAIMDLAQLAQKRNRADFLLNDQLLCNRSGLYFHYQSQLLCSNLGQLRSIVLAIMD